MAICWICILPNIDKSLCRLFTNKCQKQRVLTFTAKVFATFTRQALTNVKGGKNQSSRKVVFLRVEVLYFKTNLNTYPSDANQSSWQKVYKCLQINFLALLKQTSSFTY